MEKAYHFKEVENKIYRLWEKSKSFSPKKKAKLPPFSIIMPPPNANAPLHIGHVMFITLEDIMARFHRMKGKNVLLLPGADHAGILTQVVFERKLAKEGKTRFDLGRKKFYQECLHFTLENKKIMFDQIKKAGASCDWSREKFTLNPKISKQTLLTFIKLYQDKLAYRSQRLINWCPRCMTTLSNLEVEHQEMKTKLWHIKYPLKIRSGITGEQKFLVVATTRPETMLGDTAVAVHPNDRRYNQYIGQLVILPIVNREIPIVGDEAVDPEFGTGIVKITPAHNPTDYEMSLRHNLPSISVIGFDNKMTKKAGKKFAGLEIDKARELILILLGKADLLIKGKKYLHKIALCERCKTTVEPLLSKQWFINVNKKITLKDKNLQKLLGVKKASLKDLAILAVKKGKIKILPKRFSRNYLDWMKNLKDWCISRQIWWGRQMPIWYCGTKGLSKLQLTMNPHLAARVKKSGCGKVIASLKKPKKCPRCGQTNIIQDPDTLDTWFSSGQWAYNTLNYPKGADFKNFYPTSVMETGYEILNIWVARMIMLSLYRTGNIPFKTVYLHGLVRDAFGQKMSKSKGNAINPLGVIEKYGADALRMALIVGASPGNDISVGEAKIKGYRNFANKIWNIGRFLVTNLPRKYQEIPSYSSRLKGLTTQDKQIVKKLNQLIAKVTKNMQGFKFSPAGEAIYHFIWHQLADKYLEQVKKRIWDGDKTALSTLRYVILNSLKLLHPFMPYVTEEIWQNIPRKYKDPLIVSSWPK